jgi:hypothetical protein
MLKKLALVSAFFVASAVAVPSHAAGENPACLLAGGCYYDSSTHSWYCPDPVTYMQCIDE